MKNLVYIKHRSTHHASHSGYSKLIDYLPGDFLPKGQSFIPYRLRKSLSASTNQNAGIYNSDSISKEIALAGLMMRKKGGVAHFLNAERDIRFTTLLKGVRGWRFVATFHKPPDILKKNISDYSYLRRLDGAIAVGPNQLGYLKENLNIDNVSFIPHGVDTEFYTPADTPWEKHTCLFVGQHLRDFETLEATFSKIRKHIPKFRLRAVLRKDAARKLPKSRAVEVYSEISDEELRNLYRTSAALLLPLRDTTACNSILEALACGLPVITNKVGGIDAYVSNESGFLFQKGDSSSLAEAAIHLMEDYSTNAKMRSVCRTQSLSFDWNNVAPGIEAFYKRLNR